MAPGKHRTLIVPFLQSFSSRIWDRIKSPIIKVVPFLHVWVSSTLSSDIFQLEYALSLTVKSLSTVNFLAFSISALNWSMVLSMVSARQRLASLSGALIYGRQIRGASKIEIDKFIINIFIRCFLVCCVIIANFEQVLFKSFMFQNNFVRSVIIAF